MLWFEILEDERHWGDQYEYDLDATHKWGLPGIRCPRCGAWGSAGVAYPTVDLSALSSERGLTRPDPVSPEEFARLRALVAPLVPSEYPLPPGTEFGPLEGTGSGRFGDFCWLNSWTPLCRAETLPRLHGAGLGPFEAVHAEIRLKGRNPPELWLIQVVPWARLHDNALPPDGAPPCPVCGRRSITLPDRLVIQRSSLDTGRDLVRIAELPTVVLASERFADAVDRLGLTDICRRQVETAS